MAAVKESTQPPQLLEAYYALNPQDRLNPHLDGYYGDRQQDYKVWQGRSISSAQTGQAGKTLASILAYLGQERNRIARLMGSEQADQFGVDRRDPEKGKKNVLTHLTAPRYGALNGRLRDLFLSHIAPFRDGALVHEVFKTKHSRFIIEKLNQQKLVEQIRSASDGSFRGSEEKFEELRGLLDCILNLHEFTARIYPDLEIPKIVPASVDRIASACLQSPLQFLVGTMETKVKGEWKTLTRYAAWFVEKNPKSIGQNGIDIFQRRGFVTLIHVPTQNLTSQIEALENICNRLLSTKYEDRSLMLRDLSFLQYKLFHLTPFNRGSASVVEIIMKAVHNQQGLPELSIQDADPFCEPRMELFMSRFKEQAEAKISSDPPKTPP